MNNIMNNIKREAKKFWNDEDGMGVVEVCMLMRIKFIRV